MPVCQHGTTAEQAFELITRELVDLQYAKYVQWRGHNASVSVGFGQILHIEGRITNTEILVEFGGIFGGTALIRCQNIVGTIFPGRQLI